MIKRIVKLTFKEAEVDSFVEIFQQKKEQINSFKGCSHLELWRDVKDSNVFFTYSFWESETDLNRYRHSELFQSTWKKTKKLFAGKPQAWSVEIIEGIDELNAK